MPTSPHRRVQRDATAKRRRSRVQRASEAPDGSDHDLPGYDARRVCARRRDCAQIAFLEVQSDFWDAAGPHDSELQKLMDFMEGSACADALSALIPLAFCGRSQRCWRRDADFSFIAERRDTLRLRGDARGCNGHRRRRMVKPPPTLVRCPSRLRENRDLRAIAFLEAQMLPCVTALK